MKKTLIMLLSLGIIGCTSIRKNLECFVEKDPIRENKLEENFIVIYNQDNSAFKYLKKRCESIKDSIEKKTHRKVNLKIYEIKDKDLKENPKKIKSLKNTIDSVWTDFALKNGKIDYAALGFHSTEERSLLNSPKFLNKKKCNRKNYKIYKNEVKNIARNNEKSKFLFSDKSKLIYHGCSAFRGDSSIAQTFFEEYKINEVEAPEEVYWGEIIWDKDDIYLTSEKHLNWSRKKGFRYKKPNGDICYISFPNYPTIVLINETKNSSVDSEYNAALDLVASIRLNKKPDLAKNNYELLKKSLEEKNYEILDWNKPIESFYKVRTFRRKH